MLQSLDYEKKCTLSVHREKSQSTAWHTSPVKSVNWDTKWIISLTCTCDYTGIAQEGIIGEGQPGTSKVKCDGWSLVEKKRTHFLYLSSSRSVSLPLPSSHSLSLSQSLFLTLSPSLSHSLSLKRNIAWPHTHTHIGSLVATPGRSGWLGSGYVDVSRIES
jgi:hypothetical protein